MPSNCLKNVLIVDGIEDKIPEPELKRLFGQVGAVTALNVSRRPDGSAFAQVVMARPQDAADAILKYNGTQHRGTVMQVRFKAD